MSLGMRLLNLSSPKRRLSTVLQYSMMLSSIWNTPRLFKLQSRRSLEHLCSANVCTEGQKVFTEGLQRVALTLSYMDMVSCSNIKSLAIICDRFGP